MTGRRWSVLLLAPVALAWLSGDTDAAAQNEPAKPVGAIEALGAAGQVKDAVL